MAALALLYAADSQFIVFVPPRIRLLVLITALSVASEKLASEGVTVFVSSHLLSELEMISKHLVMLRKGEVIFSGPIQELLQRNKPTIVAKPTSRNSLPYLAEIINKTGHVAIIEDDHVRVDADEAFAVTLNKLAFESGIVLAQLTPVRASLEETFFELTGGQS